MINATRHVLHAASDLRLVKRPASMFADRFCCRVRSVRRFFAERILLSVPGRHMDPCPCKDPSLCKDQQVESLLRLGVDFVSSFRSVVVGVGSFCCCRRFVFHLSVRISNPVTTTASVNDCLVLQCRSHSIGNASHFIKRRWLTTPVAFVSFVAP